MPILYPFAALFYFVLFWVYKGLLLKYYSRTTKFNEEIPMKSLFWVKFSIVVHLFISSLMLSNQNFYSATKDTQSDGSVEASSFEIKNQEVFFIAYFQRLESGSQSTIYLTFMVILFFGWLLLVFLDSFLSVCSCLKGPIYYILNQCTCCHRKKNAVRSKDIFTEFQVASLLIMFNKAKYDLKEFNREVKEIHD